VSEAEQKNILVGIRIGIPSKYNVLEECGVEKPPGIEVGCDCIMKG